MHQLRQLPARVLVSLRRPWSRLSLIMALSMGGLLGALAIGGLFALVINGNVEEIAADSLQVNTDQEAFGELGEEVRIDIVALRFRHRVLMIDPGENIEIRGQYLRTYSRLHDRIDQMESLNHEESNAPSPADLRAHAQRYHATFWTGLTLFSRSSPEMQHASSVGLAMLSDLEESTKAIDLIDEAQAEIALGQVQDTNAQGRIILLSVLIGLGLTCAALGWLAFRVSGQMRGLYESEQAATTQLTDALSARNVFIADASHELRTPLTVLKGNAELGLVIQHDCAHDEILREIVAESDRMTRLVENLLFLARSDGATVPLKVETFAAEVLTRGIAARAEMLVQEHGGVFVSELAGNGTVSADQGQIEQAVMILVDNAAKYSPPGGQVFLRTSTLNDEFVIDVVDHGPGIPPADLPHIFERFYRVDKARSRSLGGVGLGLSIATTIVEAHSGSLEVDSRVGKGTRMRIKLPLSTSTNALRPTPHSSSALRTGTVTP